MTEMSLEGMRKLQKVANNDEDWADAVQAYVDAIIETEEKFVMHDGKIVLNEAIDWDE